MVNFYLGERQVQGAGGCPLPTRRVGSGKTVFKIFNFNIKMVFLCILVRMIKILLLLLLNIITIWYPFHVIKS